jgi:uncharacterized protein
MLMQIFYIHGFASSGNSSKSIALKQVFGANNVIAPDFPVNPDMIEKMVNDLVRKNKNYPIIFVGTSIGGFWANYFAQKWDTLCVIVNPATKPSKTLAKYVGKKVKNYATGQSVIVTPADLAGYEKREQYLSTHTDASRINMFIASDDDVVSPQETLSSLPDTAFTDIKNTGGHRFEKYWNDVISRIKILLKK